MEQPLWKTLGRFLKNVNIGLSYDTAIPLLVVYPRELTIYVCTETCMSVHGTIIRAAKTWKQTKSPSVDEKINKMSSTVEYYPSIKRNDVLIQAVTLMSLENMPHEGGQS